MRRVQRRALPAWCGRECLRPCSRTTRPARRTPPKGRNPDPLAVSIRTRSSAVASVDADRPEGTRERGSPRDAAVTARHGRAGPGRPVRGIDRHHVEARSAIAQLCGSVSVAACVLTTNADYGCHADHHDDASLVCDDVLDQDPIATLHAHRALLHHPASYPTSPSAHGHRSTSGLPRYRGSRRWSPGGRIPRGVVAGSRHARVLSDMPPVYVLTFAGRRAATRSRPVSFRT